MYIMLAGYDVLPKQFTGAIIHLVDTPISANLFVYIYYIHMHIHNVYNILVRAVVKSTCTYIIIYILSAVVQFPRQRQTLYIYKLAH